MNATWTSTEQASEPQQHEPGQHAGASAPAPTTPNRPAGLNRALLTLIGLILLLGGLFVLFTGLGVLPGRVGPMTLPDRSATLLPTTPSLPSWAVWPALLAGVTVALLCLRWLAAQLSRRPATRTWRLTRHRGAPTRDPRDSSGDEADRTLGHTDDRSPAGTTRMDPCVAASAVATEIESYTGVSRATVVILGDRGHPELHLRVDTTDDASISALRERIDTHALYRLRQALELRALPAEVLLRIATTTRTTAEKIR
jgi:hypothetical protein